MNVIPQLFFQGKQCFTSVTERGAATPVPNVFYLSSNNAYEQVYVTSPSRSSSSDYASCAGGGRKSRRYKTKRTRGTRRGRRN